MKQNFSKRLEMQIPHETTYPELKFMTNDKHKLSDILKKHYKFPSHNLNEIKDFINEDEELEKMVNELPDNISKELSFDEITLDFMKETDPHEKILEIIIYTTELNEKALLKKEDAIIDGIIDKYPKTVNEYIILVEC